MSAAAQLFAEGVKKGDLRENMEILPTIFQFWGMLPVLLIGALELGAYLKNVSDYKKKVVENALDQA